MGHTPEASGARPHHHLPMPSPRPLPILLAAVTIGIAVLLGGTGRADAAVVARGEQDPTAVLAAAERVGIDVDGRWFALFAGALLLIPARRAKRTAGPEPTRTRLESGPERSTDRDDDDVEDDGAVRPLALPASRLDDLDPEVVTAVLQVWADR